MSEKPEGRRRKHRRVIRRGTESSEVSGVSSDEQEETWGEKQSNETTESDYAKDRPPHWRN